MKRLQNCFSVLLCTLLCANYTTVAASKKVNTKEKGIVILHENDVHCSYLQGYTAMSRMRNAISDTAWVATVSAGDFMQGQSSGSVSKGQYMIDIMSAMHYDAVTLGNHEFDYGIEYMNKVLGAGKKDAALPVTCVNFLSTKTSSPIFTPCIVKQYGNKRVAFIGAVTAATLKDEGNVFVDSDGRRLPYTIADADELVKRMQSTVDSVRNAGADYVVVLSHLGNDDKRSFLNSQGLIAQTRGIDAVLDGHTHLVYINKEPNIDKKPIYVTQTGTQFANIGKLYISPQGNLVSELVPLKDTVNYAATASAEVVNAVAAVKEKMNSLDNDTLLNTPFTLTVSKNGTWIIRSEETNLGDLVADAMRHYADADIAIVNGGSIRNDIPQGRISTASAIGAMPYYNDVCKVKITGDELVQVLDTCCYFAPVASGCFPQVSGVRFTLQQSAARSMVRNVEIFDPATSSYVAVDPKRTYTIVSSKYFIKGTAYGGLIANAPVVMSYSDTDTDIFIHYLKNVLKGEMPERYRTPQGRINIER